MHLNCTVQSAVDGAVQLTDGSSFDAALIVWTAGNDANPVVSKHTDLPINSRGLVIVRPDLRIGTETEVVPAAWAAGDDAAVPDLALPGAFTVPNAQHAFRQGKLLARNIAAALRGRPSKRYRHPSLGSVATLGLGRGIFQYKKITIKGPVAWLMHRGYHVLAVPTWERKVRVLAVWLTAALFGRDIVSLAAVEHPRDAFLRDGSAPAVTNRASVLS
ncbi:NAD(P)/FAD-dependent oxidoreductase [Kutzneria sp. 744]|uniref:NAD(P)/FAD-dependent oxidoreductase n=1 Tax=Kutzneria sp. (strain 744) TaxID=345341 RepID=UPI0004B0E2F9|nr:FAD-dependent oxidoreductase [Kutzneria sp. 744]